MSAAVIVKSVDIPYIDTNGRVLGFVIADAWIDENGKSIA